jgi:hypothetical protein
MHPGYEARCFGLNWHSDIALNFFDPANGLDSEDSVRISRVETLEPRAHQYRVGRAEIDGRGFRFTWNDEATFDMYDGRRIDWHPGARWKGALPDSFYSSVAGLTLAWRGSLPLHASSLVIGGRAWLVAGRAGAGKSTLTAELLRAGAELLADDLTAVNIDASGAHAARGRPAMRLHPASAQHVEVLQTEAVFDDPRGKLLVWPRSRAADANWPISGALLLGDEAFGPMAPAEAAAAFGNMLFRPRICNKLGDQADRRQALFDLANLVPVYRFPALQAFTEQARKERTSKVLELTQR